MSAVAEVIRSEIARLGPLPFRRFMELALYEPASGYYASGRAAIGRRGDYVTSVSVGPLFGRLLAGQIEEMWERLGRPAVFTLVEQGANTGDFAHDVLTAAGAVPEFGAALEYRIVEPLPVNAERQADRLAEFGTQVQWHRSLAELPPFTGAHFSNELLDAFPVHRLACRGGVWRERYVGLAEMDAETEEDGFAWVEGPFSTPELERFTAFLPTVEGYETEVNLEALEWIEAVAARLERGYVLVADYGFSRADYYLPERMEGTLCGYRQQRRQDDLLAAPGLQDLTAHVEFTTLAERAEALGFRLAGFADQHHFMVGLGKYAFPDAGDSLSPTRQKEMRAFASLMHPALMGRGFKFLALARGVDETPAPPPLHGFEFAGDPRGALGLA